MSASIKPLVGIQYLRAIAALMVVGLHLSHYAPVWVQNLTPRFASGVDIFFVISGFIMVMTSRRAAPLSFMGRRILRIVPLYWLLTIGIFAVGLHAHKHSVTELVKSLAFIPYPDPHGTFPYPMPLIGPGWSLNVEMYFYIIFAITLAAPLRRWSVLIVGVLFTALVCLQPMVHNEVGAFYMQPRLIEFWAGMGLGWLHLHESQWMRPWIAVTAIVVGLTALVAFSLPFQVPATLVVAGAVGLERTGHMPRWPLLAHLGDASYSLYLIHAAAIEVAFQVWRHSHLSSAAFPLVGLLTAICAGMLCYRLVELPMARAGRKLTGNGRTVVIEPIPIAVG